MTAELEKKEGKSKKNKNIANAAIVGVSFDTNGRYGSAIKEHGVSFLGKDYETGMHLKKGLKELSMSKINPNYKNQNLKQQAGFAAEIKETAKANAKNIIERNLERKVRTDDIGRVNDPHYDHFRTDGHGNIIEGSGSQMKFVGNSSKESLQKLLSKKYDKYRENNIKIEVPSDKYEAIINEVDLKRDNLNKQLNNQEAKGNLERSSNIKKRIEDCEKTKKNLVKSNVSTKESELARRYPKISVAKDMLNLSHEAGKENGKYGMMIGAIVSIVKNFVATYESEIDIEEAITNIAIDTGTAGFSGYSMGFCGAGLKGWMQNSKIEILRDISKTGLPGAAVALTISTTKIINQYLEGKITEIECFEELGREGTGLVAASMFATIGQIAIPIPVVGAAIGGMIGYAMSSASYQTLLLASKDAKLAYEERLLIEEACKIHIEMIKEYRIEIEMITKKYLVSNMEIFRHSFDEIKESLYMADIDGFICGSNKISEALGKNSQFENMDEFDLIMDSDKPFRIG